jgi:hypothetical protein
MHTLFATFGSSKGEPLSKESFNSYIKSFVQMAAYLFQGPQRPNKTLKVYESWKLTKI